MLSKQAQQRPTADEVLASLTRMVEQEGNATRRSIAAALGLATVLVTAAAFVWFMKPAAETIVLEQLTSTDVENRVTAAAISPDGSQFAYADINGAIFLRSIEDKRTRLLRQEDLELVEHISWFPNQSSLLLVTRRFTANHASAWILSLSGGRPKLVRSTIGNASLSPDGSRLAITSSDLREIWIADLKSGEEPKRIAIVGDAETFPVVGWAANGEHLICQRRSGLTRPADRDNKLFVAPAFRQVYESIDVATGKAVFQQQQEVGIRSSAIRRDGRMLFLNTEATDFSTNLFEMDTDPESGRIRTPPRPLTTYREMALAGLSTSNDGRRMIAVHYEFQPEVYVAEIDPNSKHFKASRRLTIDRAHDYPHSFSTDGETVFFESTRNGTFDIFRQPLGQRHPEFLAGKPDRDEFNPIATPDGKWVLYGTHGKKGEGRTLERVRATGGTPESVPIGGPLDYFDCALAGGRRCVLRTVENELHVFHELDPVSGKGRELVRVRWSPGVMGDWSLSPDGSEVAMPNHDMAERLIRVVPLDSPGESGHTVRLASGAGTINGIHYSADGTGWFVVLREADDYFRSAPLLKVKLCFVDRKGVITNLRDVPITTWAVVSPGGKRIAFPDGVISGNVVLLRRQ
jgi:Tol biopolymer transport system component